MKSYVIDTHPIIWYFLSDPKISATAKETIADILAGDALGYIPTIVLGEAMYVFCCKLKDHQLGNEFLSFLKKYNKTLHLLDIWAKDYEALGDYLGKEVLVKNKKKFWEMHDALIVIKSKELGLPIITKDGTIMASGLVETIW